jgi:hypothetical protein
MHRATLAPQVIRTFVQRIAAPLEQVFPLLCPEMEKRWLPDWDYRMIHSRSGLAERGAVFGTAHADGNTLWMVTNFEPPRRIEFARWQPDGLVVLLEISLGRHHNNETAVCISYTNTAVDARGAAALAALDEKRWLDTMAHWEGSMNAWFAKQRLEQTAA